VNWNDPISRGEYLERVGIEVYNEALAAHLEASIVAVVNGYAIRPVASPHGPVFIVGATGTGYRTLRQARWAAAKLPPGPDRPKPYNLQLWRDVPYIPMGQYSQQTCYRRTSTDVPKGPPLFFGVRPA
jgi:hypothetical protein